MFGICTSTSLLTLSVINTYKHYNPDHQFGRKLLLLQSIILFKRLFIDIFLVSAYLVLRIDAVPNEETEVIGKIVFVVFIYCNGFIFTFLELKTNSS